MVSLFSDAIVRHDQNVSLWKKTDKNIELIMYWELERVTGIKKHGFSYKNKDSMIHIINELISEVNINITDIVEIFGTPDLDTINDYNSLKEFPYYSYHSIAHLFSGLLINTDIFYHENIIGLSVDGGSDDVVDIEANSKNLFTGCYSERGNVKYFTISSPAPLWSFARQRYNLRQGTLMALASASKSEITFRFTPFYNIVNNEDIFQAKNWFEEIANKIENLSEKDCGILLNEFDNRFSEKDNKISMLMKVIQKLSNEIMVRNINMISKTCNIDYQSTYLSITGGFALNCVTNNYLMNRYGFKQFLAPPCVNDAGQSMGIALYYFYKKMRKFNFKLSDAFRGQQHDEISNIIKNPIFSKYIKTTSGFDYKTLIEDIKRDVIIWFWGKSEIGPRALGNRSILGDPRTEKTKNRLNEVKSRQWWRPVAPIILEEDMNEWFENGYRSDYMLHASMVKKDKRSLVPAIIHLDGSARLQTINENNNFILYKVIKEFKKDTGIPILCNTSLNDCGEPIIEQIEEALNFAVRKNIQIVYINGIRLEIIFNINFNNNKPHERVFYKEFIINEVERQKLLSFYNPYNIPMEIITNYWRLSEMRNKINLRNDKDVKFLLRLLLKMKKKYNILIECSD